MPNPLFNQMMGGMMPNPVGYLQGVLNKAQQIAGSMRDPQQFVHQYFPDAPANMAGSPDQLIEWLQQTGRVNPQMVQTARQLMGMR